MIPWSWVGRGGLGAVGEEEEEEEGYEVGSNGDQAQNIGVYWVFAAPYNILNILQKDFDVPLSCGSEAFFLLESFSIRHDEPPPSPLSRF